MTNLEALNKLCNGGNPEEDGMCFRMVETPERFPSGQIWEPPHYLPGFEELVSVRLMRGTEFRDFFCLPMPGWDAEAEESAQSQSPSERKRSVIADASVVSEEAITSRLQT